MENKTSFSLLTILLIISVFITSCAVGVTPKPTINITGKWKFIIESKSLNGSLILDIKQKVNKLEATETKEGAVYKGTISKAANRTDHVVRLVHKEEAFGIKVSDEFVGTFFTNEGNGTIEGETTGSKTGPTKNMGTFKAVKIK